MRALDFPKWVELKLSFLALANGTGESSQAQFLSDSELDSSFLHP